MNPRSLSKFFSLTVLAGSIFVSSSLASDNEIQPSNKVVNETVLTPPAFVENGSTPALAILEDTQQSSEQKSRDLAAEEQLLAAKSASEKKNLVVDKSQMAQLPPLPTDSFNTWNPRFVWIGDVKSNEDLQCFAAFLIGSMADKNAPATNTGVSSGVFVTPTDPNTSTQISALSSQLKNSPELSANITLTPDEVQKLQHLAHSQSTTSSKNSDATSTILAPSPSRMYAELEAGLGFMYFNGLSGNLIPEPNSWFTDIANSSATYPIRGSIEYTKTPIYTLDLGIRLTNWISFAASLQSQQGIHVRTRPTQGAASRTSGSGSLVTTSFDSNLNLYSIGGKLLLTWPNLIRFKTFTVSLFLGGSAAGGWQSWNSSTAVQTYTYRSTSPSVTQQTSSNIVFKDMNFANLSYTGDAGLLFKSKSAFSKTSLRLGCKFIGWGKARRLGNMENQTDIFSNGSSVTGVPASAVRFGYFRPLIIKYVYSWVPYIGVKWDF